MKSELSLSEHAIRSWRNIRPFPQAFVPVVTLCVVTLIFAVNIADRYVMSTLLEPIKTEFGWGDSAVGFATGVSLALVFTVAGLPLATLADRSSRKTVICASLLFWSTMTVACGFAAGFWQILAARVGVGLGQAGSTPASHALISDNFPPRARAVALSIFALGATGGAWLGSSGAGLLNDQFGWRSTLIFFGLAGLPIALLGLMLQEPVRGNLDQHQIAPTQASLVDTVRYIRSHPALSHIMKGATLYSFWGWGIVWWIPAYLYRAYGLSTGAAGQAMGPVHAIGGSLLMFITIAVMTYLRSKPVHWQSVYVGSVAVLATIPGVLLFTIATRENYLAFLWVFVPAIYVYLGPTTALIQNYLPPEMRAKGSAIYMFNSNIACLAAAPMLIGAGSDVMQALGVDALQSLRIMLAGMALCGLWSAVHYGMAARIIRANCKPEPLHKFEPLKWKRP